MVRRSCDWVCVEMVRKVEFDAVVTFGDSRVLLELRNRRLPIGSVKYGERSLLVVCVDGWKRIVGV
ncbi:hypothetical protein NPIL_186491, partial [Nephila pilipes]